MLKNSTKLKQTHIIWLTTSKVDGYILFKRKELMLVILCFPSQLLSFLSNIFQKICLILHKVNASCSNLHTTLKLDSCNVIPSICKSVHRQLSPPCSFFNTSFTFVKILWFLSDCGL